MSRLRFLRRIITASVLIVLLTPIRAGTQESARSKPTDNFALLRDVLRASYPEVFGKSWHIEFSTGEPIDASAWGESYDLHFKVTRFAPDVSWNILYDPKSHEPTAPPENTTFLEGQSWIRDDGGIVRMLFEGALAHSKENQNVTELVESHPEWSEEEAIRALKRVGARFGPAEKKQFLQAIHLERFEEVLGQLRIRVVDFQGLTPDHTGNFAALFWVIQAEGSLPGGVHRTYGFSFEPFEGKLTGLSQIPDRVYP